MGKLRLVRPAAATVSRFGVTLAATAFAALWLLAPVTARGQDSTADASPPAGTERGAVRSAAPAATRPPADAAREPRPPAGPPPGKVATDATEPAATEKERVFPPATPNPAPAAEEPGQEAVRDRFDEGFGWRPATEQVLLFLGVQHGYALTQPKTRRDLSGPFFRDYFRSVASLRKWEDGGRFFTNYVAHPMQGSLVGFVWVQNDPKGKSARFGRTKAYWRSRLKAAAWSAAWSTQFEVGPISQASIGNVGLHGKQTWVDLVVTPAGGAAWLVAEDALDRFIVRRVEAATDSIFLRIAARMLLNPTRSAANLLRFKKPWHRDR